MFDRKYIDLIEIFQYVHIHTENMKTGILISKLAVARAGSSLLKTLI